MEDSIVGFIGFGLIGGSIAKALKKSNQATTTIAYNYSVPKENPSLLQAKEEHVLDQIANEISALSSCDILFLCAPVIENIHYLKEIKNIVKPTCIITDVGSVKGTIHEAVTSLQLEQQFIGGHPMAGSEKTGYLHSYPSLLENAYYVLTPTKHTPSDMVSKLQTIITTIGAIPIMLDAKEHDNIVAGISHLPHILASALVSYIKEKDNDDEYMKQLAAGGFKDITRIASSSPIMWQNICLSNKESILSSLNQYINYLTSLSTLIEKEDAIALLAFFQDAKEYRDDMPTKASGLLTKVHEVYVDLLDETGAIATIATILASNGISIKNIGIIHNREFQEGALRIELYEEESALKAVDLLRNYHYTIYER